MATEIEALMLRMEVNLRRYERELAKARKTTDDAMKRVEDTTRDTARRVEKSMEGINLGGLAASARGAVAALGPLGAALGGLISVEGFRQASDTYTRTINALKVAGLEGKELSRVYQELFVIAQRQGAPIENLTKLYGQLAQAQSDLKVSSQDILRVVDATGASLRVSGVPAAQAAGAILGLSQALSGGTVRAEEFNQMLEGGLRPSLQAVANNIAEAGGSVGKLRQLVTDGEVSSRLFFAALQQGAPSLDELASKAGGTTAQAFERLKNEVVNFVGEANKSTGATEALASRINQLASAVGAGAAAFPSLIAGLRDFESRANAIIAQGPRLLQILALAQIAANPMAFQGLNDRIANAPPDTSNFNRDRFNITGAGPAITGPRADALRQQVLGTPKPISVNDPRFKADDDKGKGGGGGSKASAYEREVEALNKRTAALRLDIETFGQSAQAISKAKVEQQLLNALQEDGTTITEAQRAKVAELAGAFSETEARLKSMKDAQEAFNELQQFIGSNLSSFLSDVVSGGKNAEKALMSLTKRLADAALKAVLLGDGPLAGLFGLAPTGGSKVGGIIGALFGGFRAGGGPVQGGRAYVVGERGPELMIPGQSGFVVPNNALRRGGMGGGSTYAPVYNIDARGADAAAVARLERSLAERDRTEAARIAAANRQRDVRGMRA